MSTNRSLEETLTGPRWEPRRLSAVAVELPPGVTPAGTRGRILLAGLQLFAEYGFHGTSIRDLATAVGINSATLYAHYPAKEHVLAELVLLGHEELHRRLQQALVEAPPGPAAQLAALVRAQVGAHADFPLLALVANAELHALSPERAAPALALREQSRQLGLRVLRLGADRGEFRVADPVLAATAIGSMGMQVAHWFGPDQPYTRDQVADAYADFALQLVGADPVQKG
ncbi:TetR/AcrR family transcriptional regulator [Catellatospora sp. KI3]|uniref:TetR/AcrR family transcriptional regulator n=1 Tax=Catellatospora sp. KI3 TaxID=3041620 RepID=UPI00248311DF|nr:TetR/AcrR family transcriptional regulator [Catellatospora sp. KI3]MDI1462605.1 TetR/AcrR family transcriptional regulator [Catellatospora sp. KI3]